MENNKLIRNLNKALSGFKSWWATEKPHHPTVSFIISFIFQEYKAFY